MTDDPDLEFSPLGGLVTRDDRTVQVHIYRIVGSDHGWALEVVDVDDVSTAWDELFATEREAYEEFSRVLDENGIAVFLGDEELPH
ncbi:hypothetical protein [Aureimonas glaciei]|uniref:Uncharacterized protein n=1 Tax=Aureimonas glaciei TaxID=1776957 RepID=A0A916YD45_9HYPH|nr:hypothetical protein [Aureimonas glaciei]GGD40829.1 hypothetical protein GCM10011335_49420 [Aureimonas glaciei]